jgi:hypothetical protein
VSILSLTLFRSIYAFYGSSLKDWFFSGWLAIIKAVSLLIHQPAVIIGGVLEFIQHQSTFFCPLYIINICLCDVDSPLTQVGGHVVEPSKVYRVLLLRLHGCEVVGSILSLGSNGNTLSTLCKAQILLFRRHRIIYDKSADINGVKYDVTGKYNSFYILAFIVLNILK